MNKKSIITIILASIIYLSGLCMSFPYLILNFEQKMGGVISIINFMEYGIMFISFLCFNALLLRYKVLGKIFSYLLCLILTLNFAISISCFYIYKSGFNIGMAISILDTNLDEAMSMKNMFILPIITCIIYFSFLLFSIKTIKINTSKPTKYFILFSTIWLFLPLGYKLKHNYIKNKGGGSMWKNVYYHLSSIQGAYHLRQDFEKINSITPKFSMIKNHYMANNTIDNIIVVIGESVRRKNMSLYNYSKNTTPYEDQEKNRMLIYTNAISSAGITNLSVPMMLSTIKPKDMVDHQEKIAYNIINFSNQTDYKTYWISTQGGAKSISAIASKAQYKKWINGYDELVLPQLKEALKHTGKKLIFLHINGSHPDPCTRFPEKMKKSDWDCYDTSIKYTDEILHQIFNILKPSNSILIYTSDHAVKIKDNKYLHADSKESTQVPLYVWFSDKVPTQYKEIKQISDTVSNTIVFPLILNYMGYQSDIYIKETKDYLKLDMKPVNYDSLPD